MSLVRAFFVSMELLTSIETKYEQTTLNVTSYNDLLY